MIRLASMPRSIASRVWRGSRSTAVRSRRHGIAGRRRIARMVGDASDRRPAVKRDCRRGRPRAGAVRFLVAAFGDAGHAFPAIALARALAAARPRGRGRDLGALARGGRGRGLEFAAAEEYKTFPPPPPGSGERRRPPTRRWRCVPLLEELRPDVVVSDILTLAPALAAELVGLRRATLIPHVYPVQEPGLPFFADRGAAAADAGRPGGSGERAMPVLLGRAASEGATSSTRSRAALGLAPAGALPRRDQPRAGAGRDVPAARVPARAGRPRCR